MFPCSGEPGFEQDAETHHTVLINKGPSIDFLSFEINCNSSNNYSDDGEDKDMPSIALNKMHADFIKRHEESLSLLVNFSITLIWRELRNIKVIKCPPNYSPPRDIKVNPNPIQKHISNTNETSRWLTLRRISRTLRRDYQN